MAKPFQPDHLTPRGFMLTTITLVMALSADLHRANAAPQNLPEPTCQPGSHQPLAFPLQASQQHPTRRAVCFTPTQADRTRVQELGNYRCVLLQGLALPGAGIVDLELTRIDDLAPRFLSLDGAAPGGASPGGATSSTTSASPTAMTLWSGGMPGIAGSNACIAFSAYGVWGWLRTDARLFQLTSFASSGSWTDCRMLLVDDADKNLLGGWQCGDTVVEPATLPPDFNACLTGLAPAQWRYQCPDPGIAQLRLCRAAVETDYQFYQRFGDRHAAEVYARFVLGAVAQALRLDVRVVVELNYLGLWTTPADPWLQPDLVAGQTAGSCCVDVAYEFQHAWGTEDLIYAGPRFNLGPGLGLATVTADLFHLMSGVQMGCAVGMHGVSTVHGGFSISTGMGAVDYANPNESRASPFFQVYGAGHEIGHSFGVGHTHNFKVDVLGTPTDTTDDVPLDNCAGDAGGGAANCAGMGFGQSTLMSYCIHCPPAGLGNIRIRYHPEIARCMRAYTATLPDYQGVQFVTDLGNASAPSPATPPRLSFTGYSPGMDRLRLSGRGHPPNFIANVLVVGVYGAHSALPGLTLVPSLDMLLIGVPPEEPLAVPLPDGFPNGQMLYFQQAFAVGTSLYLSNALALEVVR